MVAATTAVATAAPTLKYEEADLKRFLTPLAII